MFGTIALIWLAFGIVNIPFHAWAEKDKANLWEVVEDTPEPLWHKVLLYVFVFVLGPIGFAMIVWDRFLDGTRI